MIPAEMPGDAAEARETIQQRRQLVRAGRILFRRYVVPDMEQEDEIVLCGLEHGQEPGIVQPEMLEIGMELEPAYARRLQAFQLALPRFVTGVQSAESRHFGVLALERDGVVIGRDDLPRRGGRAQHHTAAYAGTLFPQQQIGDGPFAHAVELIGFVKMFHRMAGDFRVKSVRMNVCKHDPVRRLIQGKRPAFFRGRSS